MDTFVRIYDFFERSAAKLPRNLRPKVYRFLVVQRMIEIEYDAFWKSHRNSQCTSIRISVFIHYLATLQWYKTKFEEREELLAQADGDPDKAYEIFLSWSNRPRCFWKPCWSIMLGEPEIALRPRRHIIPNARRGTTNSFCYHITGERAIRDAQERCSRICADYLLAWQDAPERRQWLEYVRLAKM